MTWILTATGKHFDYVDPQPDMIDEMDIAHGLGNECRYAGHTSSFYSVAQHSYIASLIVPEELALEALLHDAAEAYCKDIPRPLKQLLPDYRAIERRVDAAIRAAFGLPPQMSQPIKHADLVMLATERRDLMPEDETPWGILAGIVPLKEQIAPCGPWEARSLFLHRWRDLTVTGATA